MPKVNDKGRRSRSWCYTFFCKSDYAEIRDFGLIDCRYQVIGREVCPTTSRNHLQGYIYFDDAKSFSRVQRLFPGAHIEPARGSHKDNRDYCIKTGNFEEFGVQPSQGRRTDLEKAIDTLKDSGFDALTKVHPVPFVKYTKGLTALHFEFQKSSICKFDPDRIVKWFYGPPGSGKTRAAFEHIDKSIWVWPNDGHWFQGYNGEEVAVFDDIRPGDLSISVMLKCFDKYIYPVPVKFGSAIWKPKLIIITNPLHPVDFWLSCKGDNYSQLQRRLDFIIKYPIIPPLIHNPEPIFPPRAPSIPISDEEAQHISDDFSFYFN